MIVPLNVTAQSLSVGVYDDSGLPVLGLIASTFPPVIWSLAGANTDQPLSLINLATITSAWVAGGLKERGGGVYRLDVPDAMFTAAGSVRVRGEASGKHLVAPEIEVGVLTGLAGGLSAAAGAVTPGGAYAWAFNVVNSTDQATDADSLPSANLLHNGIVDSAVVVTITHQSTGLYLASCVLPSDYASGDTVEFLATVYVGGVGPIPGRFGAAVLASSQITLASLIQSTLVAGTVAYAGPVNPVTGDTQITRGDDYYAADGRALTWLVPFSGGNPDLTGLTITLSFHKIGGTDPVVGADNISAVVINAGTINQTVRADLSSSVSSLLVETAYGLCLTAVSGGRRWTFLRAEADILAGGSLE